MTAYVDTELVGKGTVTKGAIVGQQGGIWAISPGYQVSTRTSHVYFGRKGRSGLYQTTT